MRRQEATRRVEGLIYLLKEMSAGLVVKRHNTALELELDAKALEILLQEELEPESEEEVAEDKIFSTCHFCGGEM